MLELKTNRDYWIPSTGEPELVYDPGGGQQDIREVALEYVTSWRGCIDAGAWVGMWTRDLMDKFQNVYAFEPNPLSAECFRRNIPLDKNAVLFEVGLGHKVHQAYFPKNTSQKLQMEPGDISVRTLDSFELTNIDFFKIDVDGYENRLLKGSLETIANNSPVINIEMKKKRPSVRKKSTDLLLSLGYRRKVRTRSDEVWIKY